MLPKIIKLKPKGRLWFLATLRLAVLSLLFGLLSAFPLFMPIEGRGSLYCLRGKRKPTSQKERRNLERVMGIEPTRPAWKAGILAIELHPHKNRNYNNTDCLISQVFYKFFKKKAVQQPAQP